MSLRMKHASTRDPHTCSKMPHDNWYKESMPYAAKGHTTPGIKGLGRLLSGSFRESSVTISTTRIRFRNSHLEAESEARLVR